MRSLVDKKSKIFLGPLAGPKPMVHVILRTQNFLGSLANPKPQDTGACDTSPLCLYIYIWMIEIGPLELQELLLRQQKWSRKRPKIQNFLVPKPLVHVTFLLYLNLGVIQNYR